MTSSFWGLRLEPGKRYTTTVDKAFHVTMAALDCSTVKNEKDVQCVMLEEGESDIPFILCNLQKPKVLQSRLDLNFDMGDRVTFFCKGSGTVHLTGYVIAEDPDEFARYDESDEDGEEQEVEEEEEDEVAGEDDSDEDLALKLNGLSGKRKKELLAGLPAKKKQKQVAEEESGEDSDEDEDTVESADDEVESDEESVAEVEEQVNLEKKGKKKNKNKQGGQQSPGQQQGKQNTVQNGAQQKKQKQPQQQQQGGDKAAAGGKKVLEGGVAVQDLKVGNGPVCKQGKMVSVYYTGKLKSNNKVFDSTTSGPGFKFRVGRGEVIKGWDVGLNGMKVGGKRLINCPPNMAYGQKGMPPTIPGNSALMFEVELKGVN